MHRQNSSTSAYSEEEIDIEKMGGEGENGIRNEEKDQEQEQKQNHLDEYLVQFTQNDPTNPKNWSSGLKWYTTVLSSVFILSSTIASSLPSTTIANMIEEYDTTETIAICTITMFLLGYVCGPLFWAPLSEVYGRKPIFTLTLLLYTLFNVGCALSPTITGLLICRLIAGIGASSPLTNSGGVLTDIWEMDAIAIPMALFSWVGVLVPVDTANTLDSLVPFLGPVLGPIIGNFMIISVPWQDIYWLMLAFGGVCWLLCVFTLKETYEPAILHRRAAQLRKKTGDSGYYTAQEKTQPAMRTLLKTSLTRPLLFLVTEPLVIFSSLYVAVIYTILYLSFEIVPYVFRGVFEMRQEIAGLMFIPIAIGMFINLAITMVGVGVMRRRSANVATKSLPEDRLLPAIYLGGSCMVVSLFWLGFTSRADVPWEVPAASLILFGVAIVSIFNSFLSYLADVYAVYAASALASNTIARSVIASVCPLFVRQMFDAMGIDYACLLLALVALTLCAVPVWFRLRAASLRARSAYARRV
ncbi:hypothetical protein E3P81_02672 [Wallemia ichthyophaga]|nr:hypothetical protein E3P97_02743 [Wallemia ichthyophaga]TIB31144.1 hypothetical protein E3P85_02441 [Wallemia ichthyophaga]TIB45623.1 hypothetical protein E3P82_02716 [Wallemia ichthyophaga]TIB48952.1 hypothetical protein E3P81_02672 [Wallemia ichthyophaga]TIB52245.1 hypothetical protein E3P80_02718 [Wallemia ichthyophaga]